MKLAARWIGRFHAAQAKRAGTAALAFLHRYDAEYYRGWVRRTAEFARPLPGPRPWLGPLCERADELFAPLLESPTTVIHGELYSKNVLLHNQRVYPVDWESAALGPGEIDLAALTEGTGWAPSTVRQFQRAYQQARWPDGAPANFEKRLEAAHLYLHFRWLGERPDWAVREKSLWRYDELRAAAQRLGLTGPVVDAGFTPEEACRADQAARPSGRDCNISRRRTQPQNRHRAAKGKRRHRP